MSIIAGIWLGGQLISPSVAAALLQFDFPLINSSLRSPAEVAITIIVVIYFIAAFFNLFIPRSRAVLSPINRRAGQLLADFADCNARLWRDKLGQITLATTTLLWGIFGNLRVIIFAWAAVALGFGTVQAVNLAGAVVVGSIAGAVLAAYTVPLSRALALMPLASAVGVLMIGLDLIDTAAVAIPFLAILGAICGFLIVPMNALLQHRGSSVTGAGRSIAVQGFNEQSCVLLLGTIYALTTRGGMPVFGTIAIFGLFIVCAMEYIRYRHRRNCARHRSEIEQSLMVAGASVSGRPPGSAGEASEV